MTFSDKIPRFRNDSAAFKGETATIGAANGKREVWTGDTHVASVQKVFRPEEIHLVGGGGTDMRAMILSAMERRPKPPEVILLATDGMTPWPEKPVEAKVMACLTRKSGASRVPAWIETVVLRSEDED